MVMINAEIADQSTVLSSMYGSTLVSVFLILTDGDGRQVAVSRKDTTASALKISFRAEGQGAIKNLL